MCDVVNGDGGTARGSRIYGIEMCGKTGTAQIIGRKGDEKGYGKKVAGQFKPHAWFIAFAPSDNPMIAVSVIVEHGEHGSSAAAPIAREMIKTYLSDEKTKSDVPALSGLDR